MQAKRVLCVCCIMLLVEYGFLTASPRPDSQLPYLASALSIQTKEER